jgi:hypothetical protein
VRENDALRARLEQIDPDFVPEVARPGRLRRLRALGRESVRDRLKWRAWRLRARMSRSALPDLASENEVMRRRLELMGVERDELARALAEAVRDDPLTPQS